jgi:hypothetical protein
VKEFAYKPKLERDGEAVVTGEVIIELLSYDERLQILLESSFDADEQGIGKNKNIVKYMLKMSALAQKHIKSVNLTRADGHRYLCVEDLLYCKDGGEILQEVGSAIANGITMGKS